MRKPAASWARSSSVGLGGAKNLSATFRVLLLAFALPILCAPFSVNAELAPREVPGLQGATKIPFTMPLDGTASIAIYSKDGRQLRTLAQNVPLNKGEYVARWDGMDLWGNVLPAGTDVVVKVFSGPGLRAKWEFGIASPNPIPWPTKSFGEGEAMRAGGWLGDHGVSSAAVAVGDRIFFGSTMAENGHTVIFTNLEGQKMWGRGGLEGWVGPRLLTSDGKAVYGVVKDNHLHRIELDGSKSAQIADTKADKIVGVAAHDGKVVLTLKNHEATASLVEPVINGPRDFDFANCLPKPDGSKAYNRNLTGEEQFASTFYDGGHPQTGIIPAGSGPAAGIVAKFKKPVEIGTLLVERLDVPASAEFYALSPGANFVAPVPGAVPGPDWQLVGKSDLARRLSVVAASKEGVSTEALYIRLLARDGKGPEKWPRFGMCRILPRRLDRTDAGATVVVPPGVKEGEKSTRVAPGDLAWSFRPPEPMTEATPSIVVLDLKQDTTFDAMVLLNCVNNSYAIDAWTGGPGTPEANAEKGWTELTVFTSARDSLGGSAAAPPNSNDQRTSFDRTVTTRALRLRLLEGMGPSRWGVPMNTSDASRTEAADIALLKLAAKRPQLPPMILQVRDGTSGEVTLESRDPSVAMDAMAYDSSGTLYSVSDGKLFRTTLPATANGPARHTLLHEGELKSPTCLGVSPDGNRIAVGDPGAQTVFVFDKSGKIVTRIGGIGPRKKGPWNPLTVERPCAVTIDAAGKIWVCEATYSPKRITRYSADGKFEKEMLGPPHYGGGGALDPNLKSFWYEAGEYEIDFAKGTSRLKNLNDVQSDPDTPTFDGSSYSYTKIGRPVYFNGHRYIVGDTGGQYNPGFAVCLYDEGQTTWKPAAVMGSAQGSVFLTRADKPWRLHWLRQDLSDSSFIWCDLNDDGKYQIEEVQLFKNSEVAPNVKPFAGSYWGSMCGPDLTFWGNTRLAPSRFTAQGVPIYEKAKIQPFDYKALAPVTMANYIANQSATSGFNAASMVARDGSLVMMGQPYLVKPDLTIKGGPVTEKPSDFVPKIAGTIIDNPLSFVGAAETKSPVGEVAMINGNNGRWFLWSVQDSVVLGEIFTGKNGGFGGITDAPRGLDITDNKQDWETFFGYFTRANDGNYYAVAGRGSFGLTRVEGIDEIQVSSQPLQITSDVFAQNTALRPQIVALAAKGGKREKREFKLEPATARIPAFKLDGDLADWGDPAKFRKISEDGALAFDAAWDATNLTLAYRGMSGTGNSGQDWRYIFKTGFSFDVMIRADGAQRDGGASPGDKRVVFAPHKGKWIAVLYDYVAPGARPEEGVDYTSPVTSTRVDRVVLLPESAVKIAFRRAAGAVDAAGAWSAEVQVPWKVLGVNPAAGQKITMDFGILSPDSGGLQADKRSYWSDPDTGHVADLAVEAQIRPGNWGTVTVSP